LIFYQHKRKVAAVDTRKVRALIAVVESGNMTAAAEELGYTPSGMSRMMDTLEKELGIPLLIRSKGGVSPTRGCLQMLPAMKDLVRLADDIQSRAKEAVDGITGEIRISSAYSTYYRPLSRLVTRFEEKHPGISIEIQGGINSDLMMKRITSGELDIGIISRREGNCQWIPLTRDPMKAWVPADHPSVQDGFYPLKRFETDHYIVHFPGKVTDSQRALDSVGIHPSVTSPAFDSYAAFKMVEAGLGVTLVNGLYSTLWKGDVAVLPVRPEIRIPIGIAASEKRFISPAAALFLEYMKNDLPLLNGSAEQASEGHDADAKAK